MTFLCVGDLDRKKCVFNQKKATLDQLLNKIRLQSYWWIKANRPSFVFSYHFLWLNPLPCLGIYM